MTGHLRAGHREAHVGEESALPALADVPLGVVVRLGRRCTDDVDPELLGQPGSARRRSCKDSAS